MKVYVFDAYGTLFDVHSAAARFAGQIGPQWERLSEIWRTKQLEYTWVLAASGQHDTFENVTAQALDFAAAMTVQIAPGLRADLLAAYRGLEAYPEVAGVLAGLRERGANTYILSNGDPGMLEDAVTSAGLAAHLDGVLSVASVGVFKPVQRVYGLAVEAGGVSAHDISFQSSNRWDIAGAHVFGLRTVWINRSGRPDEYPGHPPDVVLSSLDGLLTS